MASAGMGALKAAGRAAKTTAKTAAIMAGAGYSSAIGNTAGGRALERMRLKEQNSGQNNVAPKKPETLQEQLK